MVKMRDLQSTIQLHGVSVEQFLEYKQLLIDYLERFLGDFVLATNEISQKILLVERAGIRDQFRLVAQRALSDALMRTTEMEEQEAVRWAGLWHGLRRWFLGEAGVVSQAEILRARAREAIPALLFTPQNINDQRVTRSDRFTDWQTLALWFAEAPAEEDTHRLWRAAFGLAPARHLQINEETVDRRDQSSEGPRTPWMEAEINLDQSAPAPERTGDSPQSGDRRGRSNQGERRVGATGERRGRANCAGAARARVWANHAPFGFWGPGTSDFSIASRPSRGSTGNSH
jgi:uncharacterized protein (TIGR02677 family)